jgi:hypothetical protein
VLNSVVYVISPCGAKVTSCARQEWRDMGERGARRDARKVTKMTRGDDGAPLFSRRRTLFFWACHASSQPRRKGQPRRGEGRESSQSEGQVSRRTPTHAERVACQACQGCACTRAGEAASG